MRRSVREALAELEDMRDTIVELVPTGELANAPIVQIDAIEQSVRRLNVTAALNQLDALGHDLGYLQEQSQEANTAVSNIMKTKHDTVKNSISNVR